MGLHKLGKNLIFLAQFVPQPVDFLIQFGGPATSLFLKGTGTVFKELFLPSVKDRGMKTILIAKVRDRHFFKQVFLQNGDLLFRREISSLLGHGVSLLSSYL